MGEKINSHEENEILFYTLIKAKNNSQVFRFSQIKIKENFILILIRLRITLKFLDLVKLRLKKILIRKKLYFWGKMQNIFKSTSAVSSIT